MSEEMRKQISNLLEETKKLDCDQQKTLSLIAHGMALQAELDAEKEEE